ncbi:uncharacterized protein B0I36DRAFT_2914 [Microdochium trichocladiopsis]|uniref:2EXR domain-containing protein n=1 Tax=Microdochium trichocladiopsis TaxID=1682393 RepID=A0A9P9BZ89_9PEZI|nr:uncharacterized protein B0I36DRAFT_2914 [Microdochium trichocladiopsis]KAH7039854.1 hypothetical protein B0I36DRAFT_2914 [Microdochium trichocladiopsis]
MESTRTAVVQQNPLHFDLPRTLQQFPKFAQLPYDIRHRIWEMAIYVPGVHFLRFEPNPEFQLDLAPPGSRESSPPTIKTPYSARLAPLFENPKGDVSHYLTRNKYLDSLRDSCNEARRLVWQALKHPGNLRLGHGHLEPGPLVNLALADDIICVDYPEIQRSASVKLGRWSVRLDRAQLSRIKKLAVRYQVSWGEDTRMCSGCGRVHESRRRTPKLPEHLIDFLCLFPGLETLFLIDSFAAPRGSSSNGHEKGEAPELTNAARRFECGGGRYLFQVTADNASLNCHTEHVAGKIRDRLADGDGKSIKTGVDEDDGRRPLLVEYLASAWEPELLSTLRMPQKRGLDKRRTTTNERARGKNVRGNATTPAAGQQASCMVRIARKSEHADIWPSRLDLEATSASADVADLMDGMSLQSLQRRGERERPCLFPAQCLRPRADQIVLFGDYWKLPAGQFLAEGAARAGHTVEEETAAGQSKTGEQPSLNDRAQDATFSVNHGRRASCPGSLCRRDIR